MKKMFLIISAAALTLGITDESRAETTCNWDGTKLTIDGKGEFSGCSDGSQTTATKVTIGTGVTSIEFSTFWGASSLTSITIPDSVTSIGSSAFKFASSLTSITIPEGVTYIGSWAFNCASSLESITIPEGVTSIWDGAFCDASSLTSITIPDSVTSIGEDAFWDAKSLTNIMCKGDGTSCADTVNALRAAGYTGNISYPTDKTSCEGSDISLFVWDGSKCSRRNEEQCNSVAKYYYSDGKCQVLPKTQSACTGTNIEWNATDNKCVNKNYTPTGGDDIGDVSGDFNPADCYNNGQVPYNNQCLDEYPFAKKRWTPAEANEWLHDGNDNFVVITFKK